MKQVSDFNDMYYLRSFDLRPEKFEYYTMKHSVTAEQCQIWWEKDWLMNKEKAFELSDMLRRIADFENMHKTGPYNF